MDELPINLKRSIGKYEPIETEGFTLYPIKVSEYHEYQMARPAICFIQQTLPVSLMSVPLLEAFFRIDMGMVEGMEPTGLFASALVALALGLRLMPDADITERINQFLICTDPNDPKRLKYLSFVLNGEETKTITPVQFARLRKIIAAQNGMELESDDANPELIKAERDLASAGSVKLDASIEALVSGVCNFCKAEESEVYEWAILKLLNRSEAAKKMLDYIICGIGETQGTTWKGGNPHPSPWFSRIKEGSASLMPIEQFANGQGMQAMRDAGAINDQSSKE